MMFKRKTKLYISEPAQRYFLTLQFSVFLVALVFLFAVIMHDVGDLMEPLAAAGTGASTILLDQLIFSLFVKIAILFSITFILNALLGLFFLERLTGPLKRIRRILEEAGSGRISNVDVKLRKSDYPKDIAKALTLALAEFKKNHYR